MGSSSSSRFAPPLSSFARCTRFRSPPDSEPTFCCWSRPLKLNHDTYARDATVRFPRVTSSCPSRDLLPHRFVRIELAGLIDVPQLDGFTNGERAGIWLFVAGQHAEHRRLPRTVRTDHTDNAARRQVERQLVHQHAIAVSLADGVSLDHDVAEPGPGGDVRSGPSRASASGLQTTAARRNSDAPCPWLVGPRGDI